MIDQAAEFDPSKRADIRTGLLPPYPTQDTPSPTSPLPRPDSLDVKQQLQNIRNELARTELGEVDTRRNIRRDIHTLRSELASQRLGIAETVQTLKAAIETTPDAGIEEFAEILEPHMDNARLTAEQRLQIGNTIRTYQHRHQAIEAYTTSYTPDELYTMCFGVPPRGMIRMEKGPLHILFHLDNNTDFLRAATVDQAKGRLNAISPQERRRVKRTLASLAPTVGIPDLANTVIIENSNTLKKEPAQLATDVVNHEVQHVWNRLFQPAETATDIPEIFDAAASDTRSREENTNRLIHDYLRYIRKLEIDPEARDEILAFVQEGLPREEIEEFLLSSTNKKKVTYDLMADKNWNTKNLFSALESEMAIYEDIDTYFTPISPDILEPHVQQVFHEEYENTILLWLDAIEELKEKGYDNDTILGLLYTHPASQWDNLARDIPQKTALLRLAEQLPEETKEKIADE